MRTHVWELEEREFRKLVEDKRKKAIADNALDEFNDWLADMEQIRMDRLAKHFE